MKRLLFSGIASLCIIFFVFTAFICTANALEIPGLVKALCSSTCSSVSISYLEEIESGLWNGIFQVQKDNSVLFNVGSYADSMFVWENSVKNVAFITQNTTSGENAVKAIAVVNDYMNANYPDTATVLVLSDTDNDGEAETAIFSESFTGSNEIMVNP